MKEKGRAGRSGFTLVELMIVLAIIAIIAAFAIPNLMKSRMGANEAGAIGTLRTLITAQATYMNRHHSYGTLETLHEEGLIESHIKDGESQGYFYGEFNTTRYAYTFGAVPADKGRSGDKEFIATQAGTVYERTLEWYDYQENTTTSWTVGGTAPFDALPFTSFTTEPENDANWVPVGG